MDDDVTGPQPRQWHAAGVEISPSREQTWVALVRAEADLRVTVLVLDPLPGTDPAPVARLCFEHQVDGLGIDQRSPSATLVVPLRDAGVPLRQAGPGDVAAATGQFMDWIRAGRVILRGHPAVDTAAQFARPRKLAGAVAVHRYGDADVAPLMAAELACWAMGDPADAAGIDAGVWML